MLAGQGARMLLQFLSVTVLARLLSPDDYGLLAVGRVGVGIGETLRDFGLSHAAIQAPVLTSRQRDGLFWLTSAAGTLMGLAALADAGPVADVLHRPHLA